MKLRFTLFSAVMPALVAGIHVLEELKMQSVDGRDKPGHDYVVRREKSCQAKLIP
jgi:hypothetical protein